VRLGGLPAVPGLFPLPLSRSPPVSSSDAARAIQAADALSIQSAPQFKLAANPSERPARPRWASRGSRLWPRQRPCGELRGRWWLALPHVAAHMEFSGGNRVPGRAGVGTCPGRPQAALCGPSEHPDPDLPRFRLFSPRHEWRAAREYRACSPCLPVCGVEAQRLHQCIDGPADTTGS